MKKIMENIIIIGLFVKIILKQFNLLIEYANQHQIILELNEKDKDGQYPLYWAISNRNVEIVQLLLKYALQHQIILKLNEKDIYGQYPLYWAIRYNNIEIVKLLLKYALQNKISLEYEKNYWFIEDKPKIKILIQNYEQGIEMMKVIKK